MKPRVTLEQSNLPDGTPVALHEHDGRHYLTVDGIQTASPATRVSERAMAEVACAPFRPARQPRIWITGLGTGSILAGVQATLLQKKGAIHIAEPCRELRGWLREHLSESDFLEDPRLAFGTDPTADGLLAQRASLHAVLLHADTAPLLDPTKQLQLFDDRRWLTAAFDALLDGGLLAIASSKKIQGLAKKLERAGFTVAFHEVDAVPNARKPRKHFLLLGRKGKYAS